MSKQPPVQPDLASSAEPDSIITALKDKLALAEERERRALSDYQNLVRRSREDAARMAKFAALDFVEGLLEPLSHLTLASEQLKDPGLKMVIDQLWQNLNEAGLEEINPLNLPFAVETMEAVPNPKETQGVGSGKVIQVVAKGYKLNGEVIRHAKVIVD